MSEGMTSPAAPAASAPSSAPEGGSASAGTHTPSGSVEAEASSAGVESPTSTPNAHSDTLAASEGSFSEEKLLDSATDPLAGFDATSWDGNFDSLPDLLREPVSYLHKQLEKGYTRKFQDLAQQRKAFDERQEELKAAKPTDWDAQKKQLEEERDLLRSILSGAEDPRLSKFTQHNTELQAEIERLTSEYADFKGLVEADIDAQAETYAEEYKKRNAHIFKNEEKRLQLAGMLNEGWDPESAAKLIGQNEKTIELANQLRKKGTPTEVAVEHALLKAGKRKRTPRPGAQLTSGAESRNNPASVRNSTVPASAREARLSAARQAINWSTKNRLS